MKGKIFLIVAAIVVALALTAFVVFPTNEDEKVQTTENTSIGEICEHHCTCSDCSSGGYITHQDSCKKCYFESKLNSFYCGKCDSRMNTSSVYKNGYLYTTCTCTNTKCNHSCIFKKKQ